LHFGRNLIGSPSENSAKQMTQVLELGEEDGEEAAEECVV